MEISKKEIQKLALDILNETKKDPHTAPWKRCFKDVSKDKSDEAAAKICTSSIGYDDSFKKKSKQHENEDKIEEGVGRSLTMKKGANAKPKVIQLVREVKNIMESENPNMEKIKEHLQELKVIQEMMGVSLSVKKQTGGQPESMKEDSINENFSHEEFIPHGTYTIGNAGGYEIMISDDGDGAKIRDAFGSENPKISDWLEIEYIQDEDDPNESIPVIDPNGYNIPLNQVMKL